MIKPRIQSLTRLILNTSLTTWVLLGFIITFLLFFMRPVYLIYQVMPFPQYIPAMDPIGVDLKQMLSYSESWFIANQTPYIGNNLYPPLASVLFTPLLTVQFSLAYKIVTLINVLFYVLMTLVLTLRIGKERKVSSLLTLVFITGLFSYGFLFELERGQFDVIATFICFLAIWIYHSHNRYRYLAYLLFTISVQLKIFPFIFIVIFIADWHNWRNNIKRFLALSIVNLALLFVLGPSVFFDFIKAIKAQTINPYVWVGNHSIHSFVTFVSTNIWSWVNQYSELAQFLLLAIIAICIFLIMLQAYRQKESGINPYLFIACTIGALLIPSVSNDYTLSILAAPVAILFSAIISAFDQSIHTKILYIILILVFTVAYCSTLFSFTYKPLIFENNCPALVAMILAITCLSILSKSSLEGKASEAKETT